MDRIKPNFVYTLSLTRSTLSLSVILRRDCYAPSLHVILSLRCMEYLADSDSDRKASFFCKLASDLALWF